MTTTRRPSRLRIAVIIAAVAVVAGGVVATAATIRGATSPPSTATGADMPNESAVSGHPVGNGHHALHADTTMAAAPAPVRLGPQGRHPQFVVDCDYSHSAPDDPIVVPGNFGGSHLHDFFGATTADAASTPASLEAGDTTCHNRDDTASYWVPALFDGDDPIVPVDLVAYYRSGVGIEPADVEPWPFGLMMLAGNPGAEQPQPTGIVGWTCGPSDHLTVLPRECSPRAPLTLRLTFPDCWDGTRLDSPNHRDHTAYSIDGSCPDAQPVPIVQLIVAVRYPFSGDPANLRLASGGIITGHGDVINAWSNAELTRLTELCINRSQVCSISSNRTDLSETLPVSGLPGL